MKVFCSYSHADEKHLLELKKHLAPLTRRGLVEVWFDRKMLPGDEFDNEITTQLKAADLILLLVSADFVDSNYCHEVEMKLAEERERAGLARIIPIVVRPVDYYGLSVATKLMLPTDAKPVTTWANQDEAWVDVVKGIRRAIESRAAQTKPSGHEVPAHVVNQAHGQSENTAAARAATARTGSNEAPVQGVNLVSVGGLFLENFRRFRRRATQAEASNNLRSLYTTLRTYQPGRLPESASAIGFHPAPGSRYIYFIGKEIIGGDASKNRQRLIERAQMHMEKAGLKPFLTQEKFLLVAVTDLDSDDYLDVWVFRDADDAPQHIHNSLNIR